jgi:hypothetical protein
MLPTLPETTKVFVSQAMQHSTPEKVHAEREEIMEKLKKLYPNNEFILIDQYDIQDPPEWESKSPRGIRWARLARSIDMMADADLIVFTNNALNYNQTGILAPGCMSEHTVASKYQNEYPNEYFIMYEYQLDYELTSIDVPQFNDNIIECVKADIERYNRYWCELISVVKKHMPDIDLNDFLINDTVSNWVLEYSSGSMSIVVSLNKCVVTHDICYDGGTFFEFVVAFNPSYFVWKPTTPTEIIIKSYYIDDTDNGIRVYSLTDNEMPLIKEMFDDLKEVCDRETRANKPDLF